MLKLIKKYLELKRKTKLAKCKRMNSEILCAIAHDVYKSQTKEDVNMPAFMIINQRYNDLHITTPKDLVRTYTQFFLQGAVSGVEL